MWISRKRFEILEKEIADIKARAQSQQSPALKTSFCKDISRYLHNEIFHREIQISLAGDNLYEFENQDFYPHLMKYLRNL